MAFGVPTVNAIGGAASDLLSSSATAAGLRLKATGDEVEGENYTLAAQLAGQNSEFTKESTAVKQSQADRAIYLGIGTEKSEIAGGGFGNSGTALDLLRSSTAQGALQHALIGQQGLITEAGFDEQQAAYTRLAKYAGYSAGQENKLAGDATRNGYINAGFKGAAALASFFV